MVKMPCDHGGVMLPQAKEITKARRKPWNRSFPRVALRTPQPQTSGLLNCGTIPFCCSSHLVCGSFLRIQETSISDIPDVAVSSWVPLTFMSTYFVPEMELDASDTNWIKCSRNSALWERWTEGIGEIWCPSTCRISNFRQTPEVT